MSRFRFLEDQAEPRLQRFVSCVSMRVLGLVISLVLVLAFLANYVLSCDMKDKKLAQWAKKRVKLLGGCKALKAGQKRVDDRVPDVKLFVYQRDEHEVLADFLQYHSYVFGFQNIVVFDQRSTFVPVCMTLALFQHCGVEIITNTGSLQHKHKGATLTNVMKRYNNTFLVPLDVDEFIVPFAPNASSLHVTIDRNALLRAFKELPVDGRKYKFQYYSSAVPKTSTCVSSISNNESEFRRALQSDYYFAMYPPAIQSKTFFHSDGFICTDEGNHFGQVAHDAGKINNHPDVVRNLTHYFGTLNAQLLHFPIGGYRGAYEKYTRAASHIGFTADTNCSAKGLNAAQYCEPCKIFVNGTDHGAKMYKELCHNRWRNMYPFTGVADWFEKHTLSLQQLTGVRNLFPANLRW